MSKLFSFTFSILLGTMICSCQNASFINPADSMPVSDLWYTGEPIKVISGAVHDDHGGGHNQLKGQIIAAWEMPNDPARSLYVYGTGALSGFKNYKFTIRLHDSLPKFVLLNADTTNALAAGHIFIVGNMAVKDGDTLHYNADWDNSYQVIGSMNNVGIIFIKGNPILVGRKPMGTLSGYTMLHASNVDDNTQTVLDYENIPDSNDIEIQVDDNGRDCKKKTPFWLP